MIRFALILAVVTSSGIAFGVDPPAPPEKRPWPFYRPLPVEPPPVANRDWPRNGIDGFILHALEENGLEPAKEASRRALVRRVYLDLIGLPPSPAELADALADRAPDAYEKLVDRLLDDRRYGERWARFWLDLARYADTAGYEGDPDLPHAWRYRDYVIDSLNRDKPYDRFIREQLAGDEFAEVMGAGHLPAVPAEHTVALTFLRLAPFTEPRGDETRHEMLSEITSTVASVFLGLTVGCAKCHDHKYDEIPTKDFYRLKAFFSTVNIERPAPGDIFQIGGPLPAEFYRTGEKEWAATTRAALERERTDAKRELAELKTQLSERLGGPRSGFGIQSMIDGNDYIFDRRPVAGGEIHWTVVSAADRRWTFFTDGHGAGETAGRAGSNRGQWFGDLPDPAHIGLGLYTEGTGAPRGAEHRGSFAEILIYDHPLSEEERAAFGTYVRARYENGANAGAEPPRNGLRFWLDASDLDADPETPNPAPGSAVASWRDKVSSVDLRQADAKLQPRVATLGAVDAPAVRFEGDYLRANAKSASFLRDRTGSLAAVYSVEHTGEGYGFEVGAGRGKFISTFVYPTALGADDGIESRLDDRSVVSEDESRRYRFLSTRERFIPQHLKRLEPLAMSLRHSYGPPYEPGVPTTRVMIRGEYDNPGEIVEAGFPSCVTGNQEPAKIRLDPFKRWPTRSRRMALADWIASPENPLTARVMVNRLWYRHFGRGIVATPSDFGKLSGGPSHPELLDWLAGEFVAAKWSLKAMHRLIVTSSTYRQTSQRVDAKAATIDPENRLLWRFRRRRLEAEAVRDSVLAVSGRLNPESYGLPIFPPLPENIAERVKYSASKWATDYDERGRKRSIYIYQQRTLTMPFLQTFDALVCDESRPRRRASVTALQALALYNGEFVNEEAEHFAARVKADAGDDRDRQIERAFVLALARTPSDEERSEMRRFLDDSPPEKGLTGLCRLLYCSNEFVYVD